MLLEFEEQQRTTTQFDRLPPASHVSGSDPIRIARLPGSERYVGLLRGPHALVVLDPQARELQHLDTVPSPSALAISDAGELFIATSHPATIARYALSNDGLEPGEVFELPELTGIRDLAVLGPNALAGLDPQTGGLFTLELERERSDSTNSAMHPSLRSIAPGCRGAARLITDPAYLLVNCTLEHRVDIYPRDEAGFPAQQPSASIELQAPVFSLATARTDSALLVALGALEDHPLERTAPGALGYIDSFLYLYRLDDTADQPIRVAAQNLSELEVVTPKWIALETDGHQQTRITVAGYGTPRLLRLHYDATFSLSQVETRRLAPGITWIAGDFEAGIAADPLLDRWLVYDSADDVTITQPSTASPEPSALFRFGEALTFTTLIADRGRADGRASRFTCEACHLEGYGDGRIHRTGRDEIVATTKPIRGLFNNRPHFSRALDPTLTAMVHNEFRVANLEANGEPWFDRPRDDAPWLDPQQAPPVLTATWQRRAMMTFLMAFTHEGNPRVLGRTRFSDLERAGAQAFATHCERCHRARLSSDDPASRLPFERWEEYVLRDNGPIVWASEAHEQTGITPYVHPLGARVPSLRRVALKWPYFTNGSASTLDELLRNARIHGERFMHHIDPSERDWQPLSEAERDAISAFLRLL